MKTSKKPTVRIKRALKELETKSNHHQIGPVIMELIISKGIEIMKDQISKEDPKANHFIPLSMFEETIQIIEKHIVK